MDLAAREPPMNRLLVIDEGLSVFAASDINAILSRMCSSLTCYHAKYVGESKLKEKIFWLLYRTQK